MLYISKKLANGRYSIYINNELAAYITCPKVYKKFVEGLSNQSSRAEKVRLAEEISIIEHSQNIEAVY